MEGHWERVRKFKLPPVNSPCWIPITSTPPTNCGRETANLRSTLFLFSNRRSTKASTVLLDGIGQLVMVEGFEKVAVNSTLTLSVIMTFFFTLKSTFQKKG